MDSGGQPSSPQRLLDRAGSRSAEQQRAHQASAVQSDIPRSIGSRHAYRSAATWWRSSDVDHRQVPMTVLGSAHRQLECAGTPENVCVARWFLALLGEDLPLGGLVLLAPELTETPTRGEQLGDRTVLDHSAIVNKQDAVGMTDACQPMGDDHPGA